MKHLVIFLLLFQMSLFIKAQEIDVIRSFDFTHYRKIEMGIPSQSIEQRITWVFNRKGNVYFWTLWDGNPQNIQIFYIESHKQMTSGTVYKCTNNNDLPCIITFIEDPEMGTLLNLEIIDVIQFEFIKLK